MVPDYFSEENLTDFDFILKNIGSIYNKTNKIELKNYYEQVLEKYELSQKIQDSEILLDEGYTLNNALKDFKEGIQLYTRGKFEPCYYLIRKAHKRFISLNDSKLILESTYYLALK
ncbi:MAG: hypothetical protein ACTSXH_02335 [Promethearchaeota archaeon]